jgi:hypothetical protein
MPSDNNGAERCVITVYTRYEIILVREASAIKIFGHVNCGVPNQEYNVLNYSFLIFFYV